MAQANRITVRMDEKEFQLLETRAQALGLTRAEVIRNALTLNDLMARMDAQRAELEALKKELWGQLTAIRTELKAELQDRGAFEDIRDELLDTQRRFLGTILMSVVKMTQEGAAKTLDSIFGAKK